MSAISIKIVLLGETGVGKTSIVNVVHGGEFIPEQTSTIGACFQIHKIKIGEQLVNLHLWDTAGQERFRALSPMYYRDAQCAILVYAINNSDSFQTMRDWYQGLKDNCHELPDILLIGNKKDCEDKRQVLTEDGKALADELKMGFYEISAKEDPDGEIPKIFYKLASDYMEHHPGDLLINTELHSPEMKDKKGCC